MSFVICPFGREEQECESKKDRTKDRQTEIERERAYERERERESVRLKQRNIIVRQKSKIFGYRRVSDTQKNTKRRM